MISRDSSDESESVVVEISHAGQTGYGEGTPIERYYEDGASAVEFLHGCRGALGGDPFALDEILAALPDTPHTQAARAALDHALHDLCGKLTGLPVWRLLGPPPRGAADLLDGLARRSRRHGAPCRAGRAALSPAEAEARRARRPRHRTRPCRPGRHRPAAAGRRERVLDGRRGARGAAASSRARRRVLRAASARRAIPAERRSRRPRRSRSTSTRTATRSPTSPPAPSAHTGSTSSSRSPAGSARRSGWRTPPGHSGSA